MDDSVKELAVQVSTSSKDEVNFVRRQIESLNGIDPRFSARTLSLFPKPATIASVYVKSALRGTLTDQLRMDAMVSRQSIAEPSEGVVRTAAWEVLHEATLVKSVADMEFPTEYGRGALIRNCKDGEYHLRQIGVGFTLDPFTASTDEINRHFRPIAVATTLLSDLGGVLYLDEDFEKESLRFMEWAETHDDMDDALLTALTRKTLDPDTITAFLAMQRETPKPLHDGIL